MAERVALALAAAALLATTPAQAQLLAPTGSGPALSSRQPVTFLADRLEYDRKHDLVIAEGHVELAQDGHVLFADRIVYDRRTGVAAASGHVVLMEPNGEVIFAHYAELSQGMKNGVLRSMSALLARNVRLAANGARRTGGEINELARVVYSACCLSKTEPTAPPLWQVKAQSAVQDLQHKRIEYRNARLEIYGVPVAWFPYLSQPEPSVKRASGFLMPSPGVSTRLGAFATVPYYWVLNGSSDLTVASTISSKLPPELLGEYRKRFNDGYLQVKASLGNDRGAFQGAVFASGRFDYNPTWRWGFDINRATSSAFLDDFSLYPITDVLTSTTFAEGFGPGGYSLLDTQFYQRLLSSSSNAKLPTVLPRYTYSYFGRPDAWGGRSILTAGFFNLFRTGGTSTVRGATTLDWERPFTGPAGSRWDLDLHLDAAAYAVHGLNQEPNFAPLSTSDTARALPQAALTLHWPFIRDGGGSQLIEPIVQVIVAPNIGNQPSLGIPNEDSLGLEFTDANLFGFNRFPGLDRLEGGTRFNLALHGAWYFGGSTLFDGLIGQAYRLHADNSFPVGSGLAGTVSDIVARLSTAPVSWLDLTYRARFDHRSLRQRFVDTSATFGPPALHLTAGYLYTSTNPYLLFDQPTLPANFTQPRNEISLAFGATRGQWGLSGYTVRDLSLAQQIGEGLEGTYENSCHCFTFDVQFNKRETSINGDHGSTALLFTLTFTTIGQVGFHAF